jgi:crossover junction endodeoxyribonuclease RusA
MPLTFTVLGEPKPQGSKRGFVTKHGKVALVEQAGKPLKDWRDIVTTTARHERITQQWEPYNEAPMNVTLAFRCKKPLRPKYPVPATRPDIDKLTRAVLDALTDAHVWQDDSQVIHLTVTKTYGLPGVDIAIWTNQE